MTDLYALLQAGKLSQRCPRCGIVEAAGDYCTACLTPTGEATWFVAPPRGRYAARIRQALRPETGADDVLVVSAESAAPSASDEVASG